MVAQLSQAGNIPELERPEVSVSPAVVCSGAEVERGLWKSPKCWMSESGQLPSVKSDWSLVHYYSPLWTTREYSIEPPVFPQGVQHRALSFPRQRKDTPCPFMDPRHSKVPIFPVWVSQEGEHTSHSVGPGGRLQAFQMIQMLRQARSCRLQPPPAPIFPS